MSIRCHLKSQVVSKEIYEKFLTEENPDTSRWVAIPFSVENYYTDQYLIISITTEAMSSLEDYLEKLGEPSQVIEDIKSQLVTFYHLLGFLTCYIDIEEFTFYVKGEELYHDELARVFLINGLNKDSELEVPKGKLGFKIAQVLKSAIQSKRKEIVELTKSEWNNIVDDVLSGME